MEHPNNVERKSSFNPEAAAFSPTAAEQSEGSTVAAGTAESAHLVSRMTALSRHLHLRPKDMRPKKLQLSSLAPIPMRLEDFLSRALPLDLEGQTFKDGTMASAQCTTSSSYHDHILSPSAIINVPISFTPTSTFSPQQDESHLHVVDMDELSTSLGLPSAKRGTKSNEVAAQVHRSRTPQGSTSALYAQYMKSRIENSENTIKAYQDQQDPFVNPDTPRQEHEALRMIRPPPGFQGQTPRVITVEDKRTHTGPATMQQNIAHTALFGYINQHRPNLSQSTSPFRHHRRLSRRPRAHTRTKRTDQGPEPSSADIYPDDAHWTPTQPIHQKYFASTAYMAPPPQAIVHVEDAASWPTPAEVYTHEPRAPPVTHVAQNFDIFEAHTTPTADDLSAADGKVLSLIEDLPEPSMNTLIYFGAFDLASDERSLTPGQDSGKRYGMNHFGIGIKDDWRPPRVAEMEPFRVRPRDHQGWGGWEWAIKKGWADA